MRHDQVMQAQWSQLSELVAGTTGLHFPRERWDDLKRGLVDAAQEFGFEDAAACVDWLLSAPPTRAQVQVLASHLTIGETYFFRDGPTLEAFTESILPELIRARRGGEQRLRIWSAACCSGEEPYSLAILLHEALPDFRDWQVTITATDINASFLRKAAAGIYGEWSFRNAPARLKQRYFHRTADGRYAIAPQIKKLVNFAYLNLAEDVYPSLETDTNAMDVIFCRNVLMYFTPQQTRKVLGKLHHSLVEGGWLVVSPSEASQTLFSQFVTVDLAGASLYKKSNAAPQTEPGTVAITGAPESGFPAVEASLSWAPSAAPLVVLEPGRPMEDFAVPEAAGSAQTSAESLYGQGRYAEVVETLLAPLAERAPGPVACSLLARALANQGRLAEALTWCDRWILADKQDPAGHYLRAVVLLEQGEPEQARSSLQRATYLEPEFVLAHFALGNLARRCGKAGEAGKHFSNTLHLLQRYHPDDPLRESDGLTAGRLAQTLAWLTGPENAR